MKLFDQCFVTGCDKNTEWMVGWFLEGFTKHNSLPLIFADFGCSEEFLKLIEPCVDAVLDMSHLPDKGWFKKPHTMVEVGKMSRQACWLDTDIEILDDISSVFDYIEPSKLNMCEDRPWSRRRKEEWHNSGVVAFEGVPSILQDWADKTREAPTVGDQEVLHLMMKSPLDRLIYINTLPNEFNWLRLQLLDKEDSPKKKAIHWTGRKGKEEIRRQLEKLKNG